MKFRSRYAGWMPNLMVAVAISLVVNFSYLLLLIVDQRSDTSGHADVRRAVVRAQEGELAVHPDGHGYLVYENGGSVYVPMSRIRRLGLADGDRLVVSHTRPRRAGAHPMMMELKRRNGEEFDYSTVFNRPSETTDMALNLFYYFVLSFVSLTILSFGRSNRTALNFAKRCVWVVVAAAALYFVAPVPDWRTGRFVMNFMGGRMFEYMLLLKCSFAVVVSILYGRIYVLISQRQAVELENEQLKNENLTTRYDMLVSQINPHFFFNSLNSLAMLVREGEGEKALTYIDQLSYAFRYIIQNGQSTLVPLSEELKFAEAYSYLFRIRYADKLFFDVEVDEAHAQWLLPALSLQPLIGNAVKHNTITRSKPFHVSIRTEGDWLVVSNPLIPKLEAEPSTGIGLENLSNRWLLATGRRIEVIRTEDRFTVRLPLQNPDVPCES